MLRRNLKEAHMAQEEPRGEPGVHAQDTRAVELVIFVGLQASGKSSFFCARFAATHEHVSKDLFRNNKNRNRRQAQLIEAALGAGSPVVVDNTNPTVEDRRTIIELGRQFGARIVGYYFESDVRRCIERNRLRTGEAQVPDVAIYATAKKLEPPSYSEGFDELFHVRMTEGSSFEVRAYADEVAIQPETGERRLREELGQIGPGTGQR
jgi:predicted kinase